MVGKRVQLDDETWEAIQAVMRKGGRVMSPKIIPVEPEVFSIKDLPLGDRAEQDSDDTEHVDVEFQDSAEAAEAEAEASVPFAEISQWRVGKSLLTLKKQIDDIAPRRKNASDGTIGDKRHCCKPKPISDHCPKVRDGAVGVVTAMDITHDPNGGCDANAIAESIRADRDSRVKYVIWNERIFSSYAVNGQEPWSWRTYEGDNPHTKHVHVSVKADKASFDSQEAWNLSELHMSDRPKLARALILFVCAIAALALLIATIGAVLALLTGHARWIELAWLSIAASLLVIVVSKLWSTAP